MTEYERSFYNDIHSIAESLKTIANELKEINKNKYCIFIPIVQNESDSDKDDNKPYLKKC